jgi:hypothetical protein
VLGQQEWLSNMIISDVEKEKRRVSFGMKRLGGMNASFFPFIFIFLPPFSNAEVKDTMDVQRKLFFPTDSVVFRRCRFHSLFLGG